MSRCKVRVRFILVLCTVTSYKFTKYFQEGHVDYNVNSELRKLQFYGAGPKMPVPDGKLVKGKGIIVWIMLY